MRPSKAARRSGLVDTHNSTRSVTWSNACALATAIDSSVPHWEWFEALDDEGRSELKRAILEAYIGSLDMSVEENRSIVGDMEDNIRWCLWGVSALDDLKARANAFYEMGQEQSRAK